MEQNYPAYRAIRMDTWPRREHFAYYRRQIRCGYSLTVRMDVTKLAAFANTTLAFLSVLFVCRLANRQSDG